MKNKSIFAVILIVLFSFVLEVKAQEDFVYEYNGKTLAYFIVSSNTVMVKEGAYYSNAQEW